MSSILYNKYFENSIFWNWQLRQLTDRKQDISYTEVHVPTFLCSDASV